MTLCITSISLYCYFLNRKRYNSLNHISYFQVFFLDTVARADDDDVLKYVTESETHVTYISLYDSRMYMKTRAVEETPQLSILCAH
jgi:hypothetical protein